MNPRILLIPAGMVLAVLLAFSVAEETNTPSSYSTWQAIKNRNTISCSPDRDAIRQWIEDIEIPPMPGAGQHHWKISSNNDSAQFYFDQGMNTYYGFHIIESLASFKKAAKFDPDCAMLHWAQALAYGPNINDVGYAASPEALKTSRRALELSGKATAVEKMLIAAQIVRYSPDSTESREKLNQLYVDKMKEAYEKFPDHPEVAALYADALMLQHPWDLWKVNGEPKSWTPRIRTVLEKLLAKQPDHPGANHYYIHVMEPSPFAEKALPSADRLGKLTPGLSHMVHMPSHIYLRTGDYVKGAAVNEQAVNSYRNYASLYAPVTGNDFLYIIHNLHMKTNHAMMEGNSRYAVQSANETVASIPREYLGMEGPLANYIQYIHMIPVFVHVRFGLWHELLAMEQPDKNHIYANVIYRFGRGMAHAQQGRLREARNELDILRLLKKDSSLAVQLFPFSSALDGAIVAENILQGSISLREKNFEEAITAFEKAVTTEENMVYNEPRDWILNPKQYLGNAFLRANQWESARKAFLEDLHINQENGWALFGLYQALQSGGRKSDAEKVFARYKKAFAKSDTELHSPVL